MAVCPLLLLYFPVIMLALTPLVELFLPGASVANFGRYLTMGVIPTWGVFMFVYIAVLDKKQENQFLRNQENIRKNIDFNKIE